MENYDNDISESDIKLLAHQLLPEIKKFFSDEKIKLFEIMWFSQGHTINEWKNLILVTIVHLLIQ